MPRSQTLSHVLTGVCAVALTVGLLEVFEIADLGKLTRVSDELKREQHAINSDSALARRESAAAASPFVVIAPSSVASPAPIGPSASATGAALSPSNTVSPAPTSPQPTQSPIPVSPTITPGPSLPHLGWKADDVIDQGVLPAYLQNTAIMTLATGDTSARHAVALIQSLRDVGTRVPRIIALLSRGGRGSEECLNYEVKKARGRPTVDCGGPDTVEWEITSQKYLDVFKKLGAETMVIDEIPNTPWTQIPGGRSIWWGQSFNKLRIFNMTSFSKILFLDADILALRNMDHIMENDMFTGAVTFACCNHNAPGWISGGTWLVQPGLEIAAHIQHLIENPVPGTKDGVWSTSDLGVAQHAFTQPLPPGKPQPYFPSLESEIHGIIPELDQLPLWQRMTPTERDDYIQGRVPKEKQGHVGLIPAAWEANGKLPKHPWKPLSLLYDQVVGHCECMPERDVPSKFYSVHFSCLYYIGKPGEFQSEDAFMRHLYKYSLSCTRYYFLKWYSAFSRGMGEPLPAPAYSGPVVPVWDSQHDEAVRATRLADNKQAVGRRLEAGDGVEAVPACAAAGLR